MVVEFAKPVTRTRETIEILRLVTTGERLSYDGDVFQVPLPGGEGKALRVAAPPVDVPIYLAALGPANLRLTGSHADGWIGYGGEPQLAETSCHRSDQSAWRRPRRRRLRYRTEPVASLETQAGGFTSARRCHFS